MLNDGRAGSRPKKEIRGEGMHRESIVLPGTRWNHSRPEESKPAPIAVVHVFFSILCSIPEGEAALNASSDSAPLQVSWRCLQKEAGQEFQKSDTLLLS